MEGFVQIVDVRKMLTFLGSLIVCFNNNNEDQNLSQRQIRSTNHQPSFLIKFKRKMKINVEENNSLPEICKSKYCFLMFD